MKEVKTALRHQIWAELAEMTQQERDTGDEAMFERFLALPEVENAKVFFAFWGMPGKEPNTALLIEKLLERGKIVGLPLMRPGHQMEVRRYDPAIPLVLHKFGILAPTAPSSPKRTWTLSSPPRWPMTSRAIAWASAAVIMTAGWSTMRV